MIDKKNQGLSMVIVEAVDTGVAPEIPVAGPCEVERITAGQVRVTYYNVFHGERRVVGHLLWDYDVWLATLQVYASLCEAMEQAPPVEVTPMPGVRAH